MLSSSSWASEDPGAPGAYSLDEGYETGDVAEAYRRFMGSKPDEAAIAYLGMPRAQRANESAVLATVLGSLGQSIVDAGGWTAAIGNSDAGFGTDATGRDRPAALVAMDERGLVRYGDVSRRLLKVDDEGPFGLSTDVERFADELAEVTESAKSEPGPVLIVLDPGDAHRADAFAPMASTEVAEAHRQQALKKTDEIVGLAIDSAIDDAVLMVVGSLPTAEDAGPFGLTPIVVNGLGLQGYVKASSTQREGLATALDVPTTALGLLGIDRPVAMLGSFMSADGNDLGVDARIAKLADDNAAAVSIDSAKVDILNGYIVFSVATLLLGSLLLIRQRFPVWLSLLTREALLVMVSFPLATYLMFVFDKRPDTGARAALFAVVTTLLVWGGSRLIAFGSRGAVGPDAVACLLTGCVLLLDPWLGSPLSYTGFLSYSPLAGARFFGMGNEAAGLLFGSLFVGGALVLDRHKSSGWVGQLVTYGLPIVGAFTVWTATAPTLGANVGVAAWGVVAFAVAWVVMRGVRIGWRMVAGVLLAVLLVVVLLSVVDLGTGTETHLARAIQGVEKGGLHEFWLIIARKAQTNVRVLTHTNWSYVLIAVLGLLGYMRWRPRGDFMETLENNPFFAHALTTLLISGFVAYFTEDSGIVIPALMLVYPGAAVLRLMLSTATGDAEA